MCFIFFERLTWACPHGGSWITGESGNMQGLLKPMLIIHFCYILLPKANQKANPYTRDGVGAGSEVGVKDSGKKAE